MRPPPPPNSSYSADTADFEWASCADPYLVDPQKPRQSNITNPPQTVRHTAAPWVTADIWDILGAGEFMIEVDFREVLAAHGPGVYTVVIWGDSEDGESVPLTKYPIFVD